MKCRDRSQWTQEQWHQVMLSDESRLGLDFLDDRIDVHRLKGQRFSPAVSVSTIDTEVEVFPLTKCAVHYQRNGDGPTISRRASSTNRHSNCLRPQPRLPTQQCIEEPSPLGVCLSARSQLFQGKRDLRIFLYPLPPAALADLEDRLITLTDETKMNSTHCVTQCDKE